ncbi:MAG TPA: adenylate/guanylate cyclase domain-containing protein [Solimonas sp.]
MAADYTPRHLRDGALRAAAPQGERKRVTVLFADIKGSTRLAEQAGVERWHQVLDRFFGLLGAAVHRYEGTINQYTGDGVMALFGAPRALEDHASRAAYAALEIQATVRQFADELRLREGLNLSIRVGLNSGEVVVGRIGDDLRSDYTAQGPTVNLAARMEHICEPGRIYLTRSTATLIEGYFRLRSLGETAVAGVEAPVEVFELEGEGGVRTRLDRSLSRGGSPFVGREPEMARLLAALDAVRSGRGQTATVVGPAGIGKSRLCHEFCGACAAENIPVHRTSGLAYAARFPMFAIRALLRSRLRVPERADAEEARRWVAGAMLLRDPADAALLPAIFDFLGIAPPGQPAVAGDAGAQTRLLQRLADFLLCPDEFQVLLIEDLHFLDEASAALLPQLLARVPGSRTLLLLNHRPEYRPDLGASSTDLNLSLAALADDDLLRLATNLLGPAPELQPVAVEVARRASGNPFFVEEAVQALADGGWLAGAPRRWQLHKPIAQWPVPDTVQALLAARIDRLAEQPRKVLQAAAVIGSAFDESLLSSLVEGAAAALAELTALGLVVVRDGGYAFAHPLMQEVTYQTQLESHRRAVHARLATLLEARHGPPEPPGELAIIIAYHWQQAGEWASAGRWNLAAVIWAAVRDVRVAYDQVQRAMDHFERAPEGLDAQRGRIAARASLIRMGQFVEVASATLERAYAEARAMAGELGDLGLQAEVMISFGNELLHRGQAEAAARLEAEAARLCLERGHPQIINRFRLAILLTHNAAGRLREGLELLDRAGSDWRTRPVDEENFMSRGFYGLMLAWMGRLDEARANMLDAIRQAAREDRAASWIYGNLVDLAMLDGDFARTLSDAEHALLHAERFGSPFFHAIAQRAWALALCLNGRAQEALQPLIDIGPLLAPGAPAHQFEAHYYSTLALAYLGSGQPQRAASAARQGVASGQRSGARLWELTAWNSFLRLPADHLGAAEAETGLQRFEQLIDLCGAEGFRPQLWLARARWAQDPAQQRAWRRRAEAAFRAMGAQAHAERLVRADAGLPGVRESAPSVDGG